MRSYPEPNTLAGRRRGPAPSPPTSTLQGPGGIECFRLSVYWQRRSAEQDVKAAYDGTLAVRAAVLRLLDLHPFTM
jgi:hypothetical protein